MNDLTPTHYTPQSHGSSAELAIELAKMLALVAPTSMSSDQQEVWLRAAIDSLDGIQAKEVSQVSMEVRRSVTRPSQIVPEISRLVAEHRRERSRVAAQQREMDEIRTALPPPKDLMSLRGKPMSKSDTAALNAQLESLGAKARYRPDGSRYLIAA